MTPNPFVPPGAEDVPDAPLEAEDHDAWYIGSVAGHDECFAEFCAALDRSARRHAASRGGPSPDAVTVRADTLPALRRRGRLVVVEGPERSGKTTFVNRCVQELRRRCPEPMQLSVVDVRGVSAQEESQLLPAQDVRALVCRHVIERIENLHKDDRAEARTALGPDAEPQARPDLAYLILRRSLDVDRVVAVLLPPAPPDTAVDDLKTYHHWMGPGMIFFAERTTTPNSVAPERRAPAPDAEPTLVLRLRNLAPGEAYAVVRSRLGDRPPHGLPDVEEATLTDVEGLNRSDQNTVGWVVSLFRELYRRRIDGTSTPRYAGLPWISYEEIADLLARRVDREQP